MTTSQEGSSWRPLLQSSPGTWIGVKDDDHLALWLGDFDRAKRLIDPANPVGLRPLIEQPYSVVQAEFEELEAGLGFQIPHLRSIVENELIPEVLAARSDYWSDLALNWLAEMENSVRTREWIERIEHTTEVSQQTRHRARRLRRARMTQS